MKDLYFEKNYGRLYERIEGGICEVFEYKSALGAVRHMFIKRRIPLTIDNEVYYDIVTPYGYGGPTLVDCHENNKAALAEEFYESFRKYCLDQNIISEFVRFHPIIENAGLFGSYYDIKLKRLTTGTNLQAFDDPIQAEFSKSAKTNIQKAIKYGVEYKITVNPSDLTLFKEFYYNTLERNEADAIYFFDDTYFNDLLRYFEKNLLLVTAFYEGKIIGMVLNFVYKKMIHIHLSGTDSNYFHLSPVYLMLFGLTQWGKENGIELIHSGGGRTSEANDKLYQFKKRFGKNTEFNYFTGEKIWNPDIYNRLVEATQTNVGASCFPAYRQLQSH